VSQRYPELFQFFGGHFHQDWVDEYDEADDVVAAYVAAHRDEPAHLAALAAQLDGFAAAHPDDRALAGALQHELGCEYDTSADGLTARQWLRRVSERFRAAGSGLA
jgi:hypothetical protein